MSTSSAGACEVRVGAVNGPAQLTPNAVPDPVIVPDGLAKPVVSSGDCAALRALACALE